MQADAGAYAARTWQLFSIPLQSPPPPCHWHTRAHFPPPAVSIYSLVRSYTVLSSDGVRRARAHGGGALLCPRSAPSAPGHSHALITSSCTMRGSRAPRLPRAHPRLPRLPAQRRPALALAPEPEPAPVPVLVVAAAAAAEGALASRSPKPRPSCRPARRSGVRMRRA